MFFSVKHLANASNSWGSARKERYNQDPRLTITRQTMTQMILEVIFFFVDEIATSALCCLDSIFWSWRRSLRLKCSGMPFKNKEGFKTFLNSTFLKVEFWRATKMQTSLGQLKRQAFQWHENTNFRCPRKLCFLRDQEPLVLDRFVHPIPPWRSWTIPAG